MKDRINTLGLTPDEQMKHGLALIRDYEKADPEANPIAHRYLAAGLASCFTALWRKAEA